MPATFENGLPCLGVSGITYVGQFLWDVKYISFHQPLSIRDKSMHFGITGSLYPIKDPFG
jgi:hypothetical protein